MINLTQFNGQEFLSLETFRKNGIGVKTPLWFAQEGEHFYVWTMTESGKVKRIRNNPQAKIAPCKRMGEVTGEWVTAEATIDNSAAAVRHVEQLLRQKLGLIFALFKVVDGLIDWWKGARRTCVIISWNPSDSST